MDSKIFILLLIVHIATLITGKPVENSLEPNNYNDEALKTSPSERSVNSLYYGTNPNYGVNGYYPNLGYGNEYDYNTPGNSGIYRERNYNKLYPNPGVGNGYSVYPLNGYGGYGGYGGNGGLLSYSGYDGYYNGYDDQLSGNLGYGYFKQKNYPITYQKDYYQEPPYVYTQYPSSGGTGYVTGYRGYSK